MGKREKIIQKRKGKTDKVGGGCLFLRIKLVFELVIVVWVNFLWFLKGKSKKRREKKKKEKKGIQKRKGKTEKGGRVPTLPKKIIRGPALAHF